MSRSKSPLGIAALTNINQSSSPLVGAYFQFNLNNFRALTDWTVQSWGSLGFQEDILLSKKYINTKIKKLWEDTVKIGSPKKCGKDFRSNVEKKLDTVLYILRCR